MLDTIQIRFPERYSLSICCNIIWRELESTNDANIKRDLKFVYDDLLRQDAFQSAHNLGNDLCPNNFLSNDFRG